MNQTYVINKNDLISFIIKNSPSIKRKDLEFLTIESLVIYKVQIEIEQYKKQLNKSH